MTYDDAVIKFRQLTYDDFNSLDKTVTEYRKRTGDLLQLDEFPDAVIGFLKALTQVTTSQESALMNAFASGYSIAFAVLCSKPHYDA